MNHGLRFDSTADPSPYFIGILFSRKICSRIGVILIKQKWIEMEGDIFSGVGNGTQVDGKVLQTFQKSFVQVQNILDQNRLLINEINQNHESKIPDNLTRNVGLIRELNNNIRRVADLYADLSSSFSKSAEASSEGESSGTMKSDGKVGQKRIRPG
ncbi:protein ELF4-LIKE 4-like isoform X1 [Actinidia eriantha]|uniref:protein ELF4-LIKE 4-like isoform X1 n=2 Tax=Actinidia eriantha TaxID=165200 RepID=UPI00258C00B9|nr:protein ELF4-LIKE 4-like isoform X1 [Actinidia eriantha]